MADNVTLNSGTGGATCATDDVSGVHFQKVKLDVGGDGVSVPVVGALPVSAAALPLPTGAAAESTLSSLNGKVTAVNTGAVVVASSALPSGAATESTLSAIGAIEVNAEAHLGSIDGKIAACNTGAVVVASSALPTGAALESSLASLNGKVTAVNTGAVTVAASALPTGAATEATLGTLNGKVTACNTSAIAGAVTANAGTNLNTSALALEAGGNLAAAATSLAILDDWDNAASDGASVSGDTAHDAADTGEPVKVGFRNKLFDGSAPGATVSHEDDRVNGIADGYGRQYVEITHPNYWSVSADYSSAQTNTELKAAPGANLCHFITDIILSNGATAGNLTLLDGSGGSVKFELYAPINGGCVVSLRTPIPLTAATALCLTSTTVTTHAVTICGFTAAVTGGV